MVISPIVYKPSGHILTPELGSGTLFLVTTAHPIVTSSLIFKPAQSILSAIVNVPSANVTDVTMLPSSRSTSYLPILTNFYPQVSISLTNLRIIENDKISAEVNVNLMEGNRTSGVSQFIFYYDYTVQTFGEKNFYICPDGIYDQNGIINNVTISMTSPNFGNGNLSLRLLLPGSVYTEICYVDDGLVEEGTTTSTFFAGQQIVLYNDATIVDGGELTDVPPGTTQITCSRGSGIEFTF